MVRHSGGSPPRRLHYIPGSYHRIGGQVEKADEFYPIENCKYSAGGFDYDLIIYRQGAQYFASWFCRRCLMLQETSRLRDWNSAKEAAQDAIGAHHFDQHSDPAWNRDWSDA